MEIIAEEGIQRRLAEMYAGLEGKDFFIVDLESKYKGSDHRQSVTGIDEAMKIVSQDKPVILLGWQTPVQYACKREWHALLANPKVVFSRHPSSLRDVDEAIHKAVSCVRPIDPLAIKLLDVESPMNSFGVLKHDIRKASGEGFGQRNDWFNRARVLLGDLSEDELLRLVQEGNASDTFTPLFGQEFPDVCVDVDGTLFDEHGLFREDVYKKVSTFAIQHNRPVTIWTGGEIIETEKKIRAKGISWKLASKRSLRNATVYAIFDDLSQKDFFQEYAVGCQFYFQV